VKYGGKSYNGSPNKKAGVLTRFKCKECGREYKMDWAKTNHEKLCVEKWGSN